MSAILDRAAALINGAKDHPDPEGAMEALEAEAGPEDRHMFPMLWEGLVLVMNDAPHLSDDGSAPEKTRLGRLTKASE